MTNQEIRDAIYSGDAVRIAKVIEAESSNPMRLATQIVKAKDRVQVGSFERGRMSLDDEAFEDWMETNDIGQEEPQIDRIISMSGKSGRALAAEYGISYKTFAKWMSGENAAPKYTLDMLERLVWTKRQIG